jgi:hypothetical protein
MAQLVRSTVNHTLSPRPTISFYINGMFCWREVPENGVLYWSTGPDIKAPVMATKIYSVTVNGETVADFASRKSANTRLIEEKTSPMFKGEADISESIQQKDGTIKVQF